MARLSNEEEEDDDDDSADDDDDDEDEDDDDDGADEDGDEVIPLPRDELLPAPRAPLYRRNTASRQGMKLHTRPGGDDSASIAESFRPGWVTDPDPAVVGRLPEWTSAEGSVVEVGVRLVSALRGGLKCAWGCARGWR